MHAYPDLKSADYFSAGAQEYARFRPPYPGELFDWIAGLCAERNWAWDFACGSRQATNELAARFARATCTDATHAQIANAPRLPNVDWHPAPAEDSELPARSIDLVTVAKALHWFDTADCYRKSKKHRPHPHPGQTFEHQTRRKNILILRPIFSAQVI
jgi:trans-aconitate methyltransferase